MTITETAVLAPPAPADRQAAPPAGRYQPGDVLEFSWGYEQTNIDFFLVTKRTVSPKGQITLTLAEMTSIQVPREGAAWMTGYVVPGVVKADVKPIRRKLHVDGRDGGYRESGCAIRSYGWASSWDGKPANWTGYA
jgi:hypothetical protein